MVNETEPTADATGTLEEPAVPAHDPTTTPPHHHTTTPPRHLKFSTRTTTSSR